MELKRSGRAGSLVASLAGLSIMTLAGCTAFADQSIYGATWLAEDIKGKGVIDNLQTTLEVARDGRVSGLAGCNRFTGKPQIQGDSIDFGPVAMTQMACLPSVNEQEQRFITALSETKTYRFEDGGLLFLNAEGEPVIRFTELKNEG